VTTDSFNSEKLNNRREYKGQVISEKTKGGYFMDLSAFIVVISMTLLFFGFIVWMGIYSRRTKPEEQDSGVSETVYKKEKLS
jgi:hypothetical protein